MRRDFRQVSSPQQIDPLQQNQYYRNAIVFLFRPQAIDAALYSSRLVLLREQGGTRPLPQRCEERMDW